MSAPASSMLLAGSAALASAATWAVGSVLFLRALRARPGEPAPPSAAAANLSKNVIAGVVFLAIWLAGERATPTAARTSVLLASGFFGFALGDTLYLAALPRIGVQATAMIAQLNVPISVLCSYLFLGERLGALALASIAAVLAGVSLVILDRPASDAPMHSVRKQGLWLALGAAVTQAIGLVVGHGGIEGVEIFTGTLIRLLGGIAGAFAIAAVFGACTGSRGVRGELRTLLAPWARARTTRELAFAALFASVIGLPLFHFGLRELSGGIGAVLFATTPLFTLPLAVRSGEQIGARAIAGTLLGFAGVAGIVLGLDGAT